MNETIDYQDLPPEEIMKPSVEERLDAFANMLRDARAGVQWESILGDLLQGFEKFLIERPSPPQSWLDRVGDDAQKYDYHQIVLPGDHLDPYKDDLENVRMIEEKFHGQKSNMALENFLVTRNHFLFGNSHLAPVTLPRPLVMLESYPESKELDWDCYVTVFPDGSWQAYNLDRDDDESIGEDITENLERWMPFIHAMRVAPPAEGRDFGCFQPTVAE